MHPGPNAVVLFCLKYLFDSADEVERGIVARMMEFPGNKSKFVGLRNFLSLEPDEADNDQGRIWANWITERKPGDSAYPLTKVIHPMTDSPAALSGRTPRLRG